MWIRADLLAEAFGRLRLALTSRILARSNAAKAEGQDSNRARQSAEGSASEFAG